MSEDLVVDLQGLSSELLREQPDNRPSGFAVPATDQAQAQPIMSTDAGAVSGNRRQNQTAYAERGADGPAYQGAPNDYGWRHQARMEIGAYGESYLSTAPADGVLKLDAEICSVWFADATASFTLQLATPEDPELEDIYAPVPQKVCSLVLIVRRTSGSTITWPASVIWPQEVRDLAGTSTDPLSAPTTTSIDTFTFAWVPALGKWLGFATGRNYA